MEANKQRNGHASATTSTTHSAVHSLLSSKSCELKSKKNSHTLQVSVVSLLFLFHSSFAFLQQSLDERSSETNPESNLARFSMHFNFVNR